MFKEMHKMHGKTSHAVTHSMKINKSEIFSLHFSLFERKNTKIYYYTLCARRKTPFYIDSDS